MALSRHHDVPGILSAGDLIGARAQRSAQSAGGKSRGPAQAPPSRPPTPSPARKVGKQQEIIDTFDDQIRIRFQVFAGAGAPRTPTCETDAAGTTHARSCGASPTTATALGKTPTAAQKANTMRGSGLAAETGIAANLEIEQVEDVVLRQRGVQAAHRIVGRQTETVSASLQFGDRLSGTIHEPGMLAPALAKDRLDACRRAGRACVDPRWAANAPAMSSTLPAASTEPGRIRIVAGSWPPARNSSTASSSSPPAANSATSRLIGTQVSQ